MAIGDFHRLVGEFDWNGHDYVFRAGSGKREWIVDFPRDRPSPEPPLHQMLVIEGYRLDAAWLLVDRVMTLGAFAEADRPRTIWQKIMGRV